MNKFIRIVVKYKTWLLALLKPFGIWGLGGIAVIDAAAFPVPIDLILAGYVWNDKRHFYLYVIIAAAGSAVGGLLPFLLGRAGGELFLMRRIDRKKYEKLRDRFEKQEFLAMMIPSMLPPPTPWKLFVIGAGVFEMKLRDFLLAVFAGRLVRDLIVALLTMAYGPQIVKILADLITKHTVALLIALLVLAALSVGWLWRKWRGARIPPK